MAKKIIPRTQRKAPKGPVWHSPRRGLIVSMQYRFPESADDKIVVAKTIIQAVIAAHDAGTMDGENYDIHWPLHMAIDLLEQAPGQLDVNHPG
jgi:hypothetical protein